LIGDRWYLLTRTGQIVFFLLSQAQGATTLSAQFINLPSGVTPDPNLPLVNCVGNLCFADRQNRIWVYDSATGLFTALPAFSSQPITCLTALDSTLMAVGRADGQVDIYRGADALWCSGSVCPERAVNRCGLLGCITTCSF
jgi:hypothetical protein